jgi:hypothetical protein
MTTTHLIIAITIGGIAILYGFILWFMPRLTRHDLYFAVTVAPGFRDEPKGKSILHRYRIELILVSAVALVVSFCLPPAPVFCGFTRRMHPRLLPATGAESSQPFCLFTV